MTINSIAVVASTAAALVKFFLEKQRNTFKMKFPTFIGRMLGKRVKYRNLLSLIKKDVQIIIKNKSGILKFSC